MDKEQEKTEGELADAEYDKAFEEMKAEETKEDPEEKGLHEEEEKTPDAPAKEDPKEEVDENHGNLQSVTKALNDTKQHATELEGKNKALVTAKQELEDKLQDYVDGKATGDDITAAQEKQTEAVEALKTLKEEAEKTAEDYPELKKSQEVTIKLIETILASEDKRLKDSVETSRKNKEERVSKIKEDFERDLLPVIVEVHPDFKEIVKIPEGMDTNDYFDWGAKIATPAQRTAAFYSDNPQDIIGAVTAFKKYKAGEQIPEEERKQTVNKQERLINAMSLKGGKSQFKTKASEKDDPNNYDAEWVKADEHIKETPAL